MAVAPVQGAMADGTVPASSLAPSDYRIPHQPVQWPEFEIHAVDDPDALF